METERLRYFCSIVETGSLTKASEVLGVSHSGLSKSMSVLQDELGFRVFLPKGRGLELTDQGKIFYEQSLKILELVNSIRMPAIQSKNIKVGFPEALALGSAEHIIREMKEGLTIEDFDSGEIEARILDRRIDFGFTFIPFPHKDLDHLKISSITLSTFIRAGSFKDIPLEQIKYVIPSNELKDNPLSLKIRDGWHPNWTRATPYKTNSLSVALKMVQSGECAVYMTSFLARHLNVSLKNNFELIEVTSARKMKRDIFLVKRSNEEESPQMKKITKILRQVCR